MGTSDIREYIDSAGAAAESSGDRGVGCLHATEGLASFFERGNSG
jgi:hypothetical protein